MKPTRTYYLLAALGLAWNLLGVLALFGQLTTSEAAVAGMSAAERTLLENTPAWVTMAFGIAVAAGTIGCLLLLIRRREAKAALATSLTAVFVQLSFYLVLSDAVHMLGPGALIQPLMVLAIGTGLIFLSIHAGRRQWLR